MNKLLITSSLFALSASCALGATIGFYGSADASNPYKWSSTTLNAPWQSNDSEATSSVLPTNTDTILYKGYTGANGTEFKLSYILVDQNANAGTLQISGSYGDGNPLHFVLDNKDMSIGNIAINQQDTDIFFDGTGTVTLRGQSPIAGAGTTGGTFKVAFAKGVNFVSTNKTSSGDCVFTGNAGVTDSSLFSIEFNGNASFTSLTRKLQISRMTMSVAKDLSTTANAYIDAANYSLLKFNGTSEVTTKALHLSDHSTLAVDGNVILKDASIFNRGGNSIITVGGPENGRSVLEVKSLLAIQTSTKTTEIALTVASDSVLFVKDMVAETSTLDGYTGNYLTYGDNAKSDNKDARIKINDFQEFTIFFQNIGTEEQQDAFLSKLDVYVGEKKHTGDLFFLNAGQYTDLAGTVIDGFWLSTTAAVPEPAEWAAIFSGIALALAIYRRRK